MDRNEYLEIVSAQVRCKRAVPYLKEELEDHIEDQKEACIADGMNPFEAEMAAVKEMGDPVETGVQLDRVHRPKMEWKVLIGALTFGIIGLVLQVSIIIAVGNPNVYHEITRQTGIFLGGVILMLAICYMDYSIFAKYARKLWIALNFLLFMMCVCEVSLFYHVVNGINRTVMFTVYFTIPVYAAFVYSYRNEKRKGLLTSLVSLGIFVWILGYGLPLGWIIKFTMIDICILGRAIYKNWFGIEKEERKKLLKQSLCIVGIGVAAVGVICIYNWMHYGILHFPGITQYYSDRLKMFLSGNTKDYVAEQIKLFHQNGNQSMEIPFLTGHMKSDYIWLFVIGHWGRFAGWALAVLCITFVTILIYKTHQQKNQLGHFMALSCTLILMIEILFYIGGNFSVTPFMGSIMPFLGDGKTVAIVTYFYVGILLSIFRNSNVVRN